MSKYDKILALILRGTSDANVAFDDLRALLLHLGFEERSRGSHHVFHLTGLHERVNLQRDGSKAKIYQVRQVREMILRNELAGQAEAAAQNETGNENNAD